jgi:phosphoenolpyruvate-protein kinase (PTS system EI component)
MPFRVPMVMIGRSVVEGIGVGRTILWREPPPGRVAPLTLAEERARLARGIAVAKRDLAGLLRLLPRAEKDLFEPELLILDELGRELQGALREGLRAEDAVLAAATDASVDLILDAKARILDAVAHDQRSVDSHLEGSDDDVVLVAAELTPSVVASLPARVVAIVTAAKDFAAATRASTSHAAILARGRDIPLAALPEGDMKAIDSNVCVVVDTTVQTAIVVVAASAAFADAEQARRRVWQHDRAEAEAEVQKPLEHLGVEVLANVGSLHDHVPPSAEGIGLLRTELA